MVQTRKNLASLPTATVQSLAGSVNLLPFLSSPPGTVLFDGAGADRRLTTVGAENWDMTYKFLYDPVGWTTCCSPRRIPHQPMSGRINRSAEYRTARRFIRWRI